MNKTKNIFFLLFAMLVCPAYLPACSDGDSGSDDADGDDDNDDLPDGGVELRGPCAENTRFGDFTLSAGSPQSQPMVTGQMRDGVMPSIAPTEIMESGACKLFRKNPPECEPECETGLICDNDGNCVPYPSNIPVGTVTVEGLNVPVEMEPFGNNQYFDTSLQYPVFDANALIKLAATGGDYAAFTLYGKGVDVLDCLNESWIVKHGQAIAITWTPGSVEEATVTASISIDQHGTTPASVICRGPDTGLFDIAVELVDELMDMGISGFPSGVIERTTVDSTISDPGCVEFIVSSSDAVTVEVDTDTGE